MRQLLPILRAVGGAAAVAVALAACTATNPAYDPSKPHHTREGFRNSDGATVDKPLADLLRWRRDAWRDGLPPAPREPVASVLPELARLKANGAAGRLGPGGPAAAATPSATWIGHATVLVQSGGLTVLTDPVFSERASPVTFLGPRRAQPPGIALADLPPIDAVVISHNHYDHLDRLSVVQLDARGGGRTLFLVPLGNKAWMEQLGIRNVVELDWWDRHTHKGVDFHLVPVRHWSARSFTDRNRTLWGGWAVVAPGFAWYFSGDTGYTRDFAQTRRRVAPQGGFDLALLAIGAYQPRWFMAPQHIDPAEAVQAHRDLGARRSLGIHWGTFELTDEALDQPPRDLATARRAAGVPEEDFFLLKIGETRWFGADKAGQSAP